VQRAGVRIKATVFKVEHCELAGVRRAGVRITAMVLKVESCDFAGAPLIR